MDYVPDSLRGVCLADVGCSIVRGMLVGAEQGTALLTCYSVMQEWELQDRVMKKFFHSLCVRFARKLDTHQRVNIFVNED